LIWLRTFFAVIALCCLSAPCRAEVRVALVIGVSAYKNVQALTNPAKDARLIAQSLRTTGFDVTEVVDPDYVQFGQAIARFRVKAQAADVAIVYYAGHGVEVDGVNWLLPVGVNGNAPEDLQFEAIRASAIADVVSPARTIRMVVLDACRNNPFKASRGWSNGRRSFGSRGLAREAAGNVVVLMATQPGETAADGAGQTNSPFAASLAHLIQEPALRLSSLPSRISRDVRQRTGAEQAPDQQGIFDEPDWMFVAGQAPASPLPAASVVPAAVATSAGAGDLENAAWELCSRGTTAAPCRRYQERYPKGRYASLASDRLLDLAQPSASVSAAPPRAPPAAVSEAPEVIPSLGIVIRREVAPVEGIRITTVQPNTPAQGRVFGGDLIIRINGEPVDTTRLPSQVFASALADKAVVRLTVQRGVSQITAILRP
jgi:hypothetical protein